MYDKTENKSTIKKEEIEKKGGKEKNLCDF